MNSLLKRQIDKKLRGGLNDLDIFLAAINESYENFESQISLLQRAMKISSDELFKANQKLRDEAESLKEINKNLEFILQSMSLDVAQIDTAESFNSTDYIKKQSIEILKINKQREELLVHLENQNTILNDYAHMVSHDLKAPLRNIDTLINWFIEDNKEMMNESNLKSMQLMLSNVEKMDLLIKGILNYSEVQNKDSLTRWIDLNLILEDITRLYSEEHITIKFDTILPLVWGNDVRFMQLFQNLIQNAIKYNNKQHIDITIGHTEEVDFYHFYVKDNGVGIPEKYQSKVFDIFFKLENTNSSSGIGLSIVKKIVEFYDGTIWLESQLEGGTTFYFTIAKHNGKA
ncbi:HAMP domain-containing histidine kinase [Flavobacterium sp. F-328]|jgi:signal transduction histidine kinase|uniref:histidine kinase n=1 Tax=Flavobacterium erciyesense TaxID=2825842 RepID=A0ABS5D568_9FLAO|nr:HAMP domain-containing sensor histidine kinase [Flavobacterium erciyesense]MBQ0909163.1 HAMP domain-containing histidine kinase [Flavobacterium erciyesense]